MQLETGKGRGRKADAVRDSKRQGEKGRCSLIQVEAGEDRHVLVQLKTGICK